MVEMLEDHLHEGPGIHFPDANLAETTFVIICDFKIIICIYLSFYLFFGSLGFVGSKKVRGVMNNSKLEKMWEKNGRNPLLIQFDVDDCRTFPQSEITLPFSKPLSEVHLGQISHRFTTCGKGYRSR